jgi:hypothetical protein
MDEVGAYLKEAPFKCSDVGKALGLTHQLVRPAIERHSSLLLKFVDYGCKKFYKIGPWAPGKWQMMSLAPW